MSMSLESCNKDDEVDFYTLSVKVTDRGNLPEAIYENINEGISSRSYPNFTSLDKAKESLDYAVNSMKGSIEEEFKGNTYKFTISYIISDSKGETVYRVSLKVDGEKITIEK